MRLYAFQGLRYDRPAPEIDPLVAPPYDQIDDRLRAALHAGSPHQFARLTRPVAAQGGDPYRESARLHAQWLADGTVRRDAEPSLYPYSIELAQGGRRLGIAALVGLEDPEAGIIRHHEETIARPLADRVALLRANRGDLEPVFFLADDGGALDRLLAEDVDGAEPVAFHTDADGNRHLVYRLADPARISRYRELLAPLPAAIADGHHRTKTAWLYARETGALAGTAAAAKLAVLTSIASPGLTIDPIHRALATLPDLEAIAGLARERRPAGSGSGAGVAAAVAAAGSPALGVWPRGLEAEVWRLDPSRAPSSVPEGARGLSVALLHGMVLPTLGLAPEAASDGTVVYRSSPEKLAEELAEGKLALGLLLPPMAPAEFAAAIEGGQMLPPKSTRFLPKVFSGLVWADHDSALL